MNSKLESIMADEETLLRQYAEEDGEEAFATLVEMHAGMVFGTALRRTGDRGAAEEISQNVFVILAKKARTFMPSGPLGGWLHRTTLLECRNFIRQEKRRNRRIQAFREMKELESSEPSPISEALSHLDEAIDKLSVSDRRMLIYRFFEGLSVREIARVTGKSEAASQRQSHRALEKLSRRLKRKGIVIPIGVIAAQIAPDASGAIPAGMAASFSRAALEGASSVTTTKLITNAILTMKHTTAVLSTAAGMAVAAVITIQWSVAGDDPEPPKPKRSTTSSAQAGGFGTAGGGGGGATGGGGVGRTSRGAGAAAAGFGGAAGGFGAASGGFGTRSTQSTAAAAERRAKAERLRNETREVVAKDYASLISDLQLAPEEKTKFINLVANRMIETAQWKERAERLAASREQNLRAYDKGVQNLIGKEGFAAYQKLAEKLNKESADSED